MTERQDILDQILTDLQDKIKVSRGYKQQPVDIKRGMHKWNDFPIKPVVCFTMFRDEADEESESGEIMRWLSVYFYGYAETDGIGNTDQIQELAQDVENFLMSTDFSYTSKTLIADTEIKEGGVSDPVNSFLIETKIAYCVE